AIDSAVEAGTSSNGALRAARAARRAPFEDVPASTAESIALAKQLKKLGFRFVGPTTAYASMQALGYVDDHLAGCLAVAAGGD
ncbi:MAG TPA: DNA-3-methyladenine glycosylase I, partial [Micropruina sp.]|nr:DNA-3-methyladenine glycosylase I [Micropruina sp.]